eukprot:TRINITY_DN59321_c0_g2_i2.p2 TRINITY_DN59321_c0_g2~~TRINITY_DN59321_c0_g2_i2.p2  ORF type:complete len:104 (-),score=1.37 TRINITY_DN59321_c0_g2_i2:8-319(-)
MRLFSHAGRVAHLCVERCQQLSRAILYLVDDQPPPILLLCEELVRPQNPVRFASYVPANGEIDLELSCMWKQSMQDRLQQLNTRRLLLQLRLTQTSGSIHKLS